MTCFPVIRTQLTIAACLAFLLAGGAADVCAGNRALDLSLHRDGERLRCVISMDAFPVYTLKVLENHRIGLVLQNTTGSSAFLEGLSEEENLLSRDRTIEPPDLGLSFRLPGPVRAVSAAWLNGRSTLYLELVHGATRAQETEASDPEEGLLRPVHFGFVNMRTRMVLALDSPPLWELTHLSEDRIRLALPFVKPGFEQTQYGPANNLALASLREREKGTEIDIQLLTRIDRVRVFWTEDGARLVTDLFEGDPMPAPSEPVLSTAASGTTLAASPATDGAFAADPSNAPPPASPQGAVQTVLNESSAESGGPIVRGRILPSGEESVDLFPTTASPQEPPKEREGVSEEDILRELAPEEALLYGDIRQAARDGEHEKTARLCEAFLARFPGSAMVERVSFLKGDAEFALIQEGDKERFSAMMKTYQNAITQFRRSPRIPKAYIKMARASSLVGNDFAAIGYLNIAHHGASEPEDAATALLERGRVYLRVNRPNKAVEDFKAVLETHPDTPQALQARMGVARYFEATGLHEKARETLDALAEAHPRFHLDHPRFLFLRGKNALYLKRHEQARDFFFRALNVGGQPEGADLLLARIGDTYHHADMPREAEKIYRTVIREFPEGDGAAIAKLRLAGYETGYEGFRNLREENPDKPVADLAALEMARKYYEEKQFAQALRILQELMSKPFQNEIKMEARRLFFRTAEQEIRRLHRDGKREELIDFYRARRTELRRDIDPEVLLQVGIALHELGKHREAASLLESIKPYDLDQVGKGRRALALVESLLEAGDEERALALLEKKKDRTLVPAADRQRLDLALARLYHDRGRRQEAHDLYRDLVGGKRLLPDRDIASIYLDMGRIEIRNGNLETARASLNRCIGLAGRSKEGRTVLRQAYAALGTAHARDGRPENALGAFNKALEAGYTPEEPGYWELRFQMAQAFLETGDYDRAEPLLIEISEQGDGPLQKRVRIRLGSLGLEKQLRRLSGWSE